MTVRDSKEAQPYRLDRLLIKRPDYFVLFGTNDEVIPLCCPLCDYLLRSHDDEYSMKAWGVCNACAVNFVYPNMVAWNEGVRPTAEELAAQQSRQISFKLELP